MSRGQSSHNTSANFCADHSPTIDEEVPHTLGPKNTETAEPVNAGTEEEARCEVACGSMCGNFGLLLLHAASASKVQELLRRMLVLNHAYIKGLRPADLEERRIEAPFLPTGSGELTPGRNFGAEPDADSFKAFKTASRGAVEQS